MPLLPRVVYELRSWIPFVCMIVLTYYIIRSYYEGRT